MAVTKPRTWLMVVAAAMAASCATGHDGDVNIGSGQSPDPVVLDVPIAYIRSPLPEDLDDLDDIDVRELETFSAGADVWLRDRAAPDVPERNVTMRVTNGEWDVRDLDGFCATYAPDAVVSGVTPEPIVGRDALRAFYASRFEDTALHCVIDASVTFGDRWLVAGKATIFSLWDSRRSQLDGVTGSCRCRWLPRRGGRCRWGAGGRVRRRGLGAFRRGSR